MIGHKFNSTLNSRIISTLRSRIIDPVNHSFNGIFYFYYLLLFILIKKKSLELKKSPRSWPTLPNHGWWILGKSNWNSVCWSGVMTVALSILTDNNERLTYVNNALKYGKNYLESYTKDGFVTEGIIHYKFKFLYIFLNLIKS
jgi:hypothetical protein